MLLIETCKVFPSCNDGFTSKFPDSDTEVSIFVGNCLDDICFIFLLRLASSTFSTAFHCFFLMLLCVQMF